MGGATVLMASGLDLPKEVKAIVSDCAFTSPKAVFTHVLHTMYHMPAFPMIPIADAVNRKKAGYGLDDCNAARELPTAHGPNSAWAYCAEHDAWNIGIGVDIKDYLTIFHVSQEVPEWPVKDWYFERDFIIKKSKRETPLRIRERRHRWTKYFAEANFYNDLQTAGILKSAVIDGVPVYMTRSAPFLQKRQNDF